MGARFYLPVKIDHRRIHVCHFNKASDQSQEQFEFIVPITGNRHELFTIAAKAKFISSHGSNDNKDVNNTPRNIEHTIVNDDELTVTIQFGKSSEKTSLELNGLVIRREPTNNDLTAVVTNILKYSKIDIILEYHIPEDQCYSYSFIIHTPNYNESDDSVEVYKAAIDFGSEATQIGIKNHRSDAKAEYVRVLDAFKKYHGEYAQLPNFWQGTADDDASSSRLFKSYFFLQKKPTKGYKHTDIPYIHGKETFLHPLMPYIAHISQSSPYAPYYLLPNLKLIELIPDNEFLSDSIDFKNREDNPHGFQGRKRASTDLIVNDCIRIILNNLLYTILDHLNHHSNNKKYLQITLLVPNVYSQSKVYSIIKHFYHDFRIITATSEYSQFAGIEVHAMSESDASFIGARNMRVTDKNHEVVRNENARYLVIDAGKGTTDFSVIQQQGTNISKYDSIFRSGLPGSGQILTYAFILAVNRCTPVLDLITSENDYAVIKEFMECMEEFKYNHVQFSQPKLSKEDIDEIFKPYNDSLSRILRALKIIFLDKRVQIPYSDEFVHEKAKELVENLDKSLRYANIDSFHQVILAGRAFKFTPLVDAIKSKFEKKVTCDTPFIYQEKNSKFICLDGAFQGERIHININSELIGSLAISEGNEIANKGGIIKKFRKKMTTLFANDSNLIDDNFFYHGKKINHGLSDKRIHIGARECSVRPDVAEKDQFFIYYIGSGFLLQWDSDADMLLEDKLPDNLGDMAEESLYPWGKIRFDNTAKKTNSQENKRPFSTTDKTNSNVDRIPVMESIVPPSPPAPKALPPKRTINGGPDKEVENV